MAVSAAFREHVTDLFATFGEVKIKLMFGGAGVYYKDQMFALLAGERIFLKVNEETRGAFEAERCKPFVFESKDGETIMTSYVEVPPRLLDDTDELARWAQRAYEAAVKGRGKKKPARKSSLPRDLPLVSPRTSRKR